MARGLKFPIKVEEGLYYPYSENKDADQLRGYREADLCLCFRICKNPVFSQRGSNIEWKPDRPSALIFGLCSRYFICQCADRWWVNYMLLPLWSSGKLVNNLKLVSDAILIKTFVIWAFFLSVLHPLCDFRT